MDLFINKKKLASADDLPQKGLNKLKEILEQTGVAKTSVDGNDVKIDLSLNQPGVEEGLRITKSALTVVSVVISLVQTVALITVGRFSGLVEEQNSIVSVLIGISIGYVSQKLAERSVATSKFKGLQVSHSLFTGRLSFIKDFQISLISGRNSFLLNLLYMGYLASHKLAP